MPPLTMAQMVRLTGALEVLLGLTYERYCAWLVRLPPEERAYVESLLPGVRARWDHLCWSAGLGLNNGGRYFLN